jgi:hypothetical protein
VFEVLRRHVYIRSIKIINFLSFGKYNGIYS